MPFSPLLFAAIIFFDIYYCYFSAAFAFTPRYASPLPLSSLMLFFTMLLCYYAFADITALTSHAMPLFAAAIITLSRCHAAAGTCRRIAAADTMLLLP